MKETLKAHFFLIKPGDCNNNKNNSSLFKETFVKQNNMYVTSDG